MFPPIHHVEGRAIPLRKAHVDTDQVIPARFLKGTDKIGLGRVLFHDWRYLDDAGQQPNPEFVINQPAYQGASLLLALENFGCGSSREHAPWALKDYGIQAVIAPSFADIFKNNALKNRVLPVQLDEADVLALMAQVEQDPQLTLHIDLAQQTLTAGGKTYSFPMNSFWKQCLMDGVDEVGYTLSHLENIQAYEQTHPGFAVPLEAVV